MSQDWRSIWTRRGDRTEMPRDLQELIEIDGYDIGASHVSADDLRAWVRPIADWIGVTDDVSVYEVGCGAGAFLAALLERYDVVVGGCDYSPTMVDIARKMLPRASIDVGQAAELPATPAYDVVLSRGVFHYFPDLQYAERTLARMIQKARKTVAIVEIADARCRDEVERMRRDRLPEGVYDKMYAGLSHLYYTPDWFERIAAAHGCSCEHRGHDLQGYAQSRFRFDALIRVGAASGHRTTNRS